MAAGLFDRFKVIDTDTHITEPADVWTSRVASKWGDAIPHVERVDGRDLWMVAGQPAGAPGAFTAAGFEGTMPDFRATYEDLPPSSYDAKARLEHMDAEGIYAQVLYPNIGGFGSGRFLALKKPELMLECVRAYNDFLVEWCSVDPNRLIPVMASPFWDVDAWVKELERCALVGHRAVLACGQPQAWDQPPLAHRHWDPVWSAAQDAGLSISFHIGSGDLGDLMQDPAQMGTRANFAKVSALYFIDNSKCLAELIFGGVCHRFPRLKMVSVESGAGWMQSAVESFDWQWRNSGVAQEHPEYDLLPSEYFRRQIYGCFWFEETGICEAIRTFPDNILYETDFPHPTCMAPGPNTPAEHPRVYAERALSELPDELLQKVLHDTAASLYKVN